MERTSPNEQEKPARTKRDQLCAETAARKFIFSGGRGSWVCTNAGRVGAGTSACVVRGDSLIIINAAAVSRHHHQLKHF